jgi:diguanylate cyclase (GGDEF)-like protein
VQQRWQFDRLAYQQSHDVLTGLLNRSQFRSQARAAAGGYEKYAVVLVDVNAFHEVNETYGHMTGDALLVEVGAALRARIAADDIVGRVGDDVFGVFLSNPSSKEFARERALDLAGSFSRAFSTGDREGKDFVALTASIGVAVGPDDGARFDAILAHAETALFTAKERGHGSVVLYETGMEGDAPRRAALRNELIAAVSGNEFVLHYQPHVDIGSGEVAGCEALIRWRHPTRGLLLPGEFIPFAEQTGIIANIDAWVLTNALAASEELRRLRPAFRLYFNLSGRQAGDSGIVRAFTEASRCGVELRNLGIEITESDAMRDVEATRHVCESLRALGARIAIDDFGTGYSSLASLKELAIDIVKIDRSFISGILTDPSDEAIAETILSITQRFGFEALGEGVERQAEIDWLRARSCRYAQGYAISHALPMAEFKAWLAAYPAEP